MSLAQFFEFNEQNFLNGQARLLFSPLTGTDDAAVPTTPADIFGQVSPYDPIQSSSAGNWYDVGGTSAPPVYTFAPAMTEWKIQQQVASVLRVINEITHTIKFDAAEFKRSDLLKMFFNANDPAAIGAATGHSAFEQVFFGQFTDLNQYRVALAAFQPLQSGKVIEGTSGPSRPAMVVQVFNRVSIEAGSDALTYGLGDMVSLPITLKAYPEPGAAQNEEYGSFFLEAPGTIATS